MRRCLSSRGWISQSNASVCSSCARGISTTSMARASASTSTASKHGLELLPDLTPGLAQSREYRDLLHQFDQPSHLSSPDATWNAYSSLIRANLRDPTLIPTAVHQRALRRSIPLYSKMLGGPRSAKARKSRDVASLTGWCPYQRRIDTILEHIHLAGSFLPLDDCHMILLHNATWGNVRGSLNLLQSIIDIGRSPTERTYELVLYSLVRKLALVREWERTRSEVVSLIQGEFYSLVEQMKGRGIKQTPIIMDHCTRIVGAISSSSGFAGTVASLHGVDIAQPDTIPPRFVQQFLQLTEQDSRGKFRPSDPRDSVTLPPISTATLNTLVHVLGSGPDASLAAMVGAFETLTTPIPPLRTKEEAYGYEDGADDDEPYYATQTPSSLRRSHPARPNTQTFTYLIKNSVNLRSKVFAKHYLDQAIEAERSQETAIRAHVREILCDPVDGSMQITEERVIRLRNEVPRGTVNVNAYMFKSLYRYADERGDIELMRWISQREAAILEEKKESILLLNAVQEAMRLQDLGEQWVSNHSPNNSTNKEQHLPVERKPIYDHTQHLRLQTRSAAEIGSQIDVASGQLLNTEAEMAKAGNAINRLRQRKLDREATTLLSQDSGEESESNTPGILSKLRDKLRRKWASALVRTDLQRQSEESPHSIGQEILASSAFVDAPEGGVSADAEIDTKTLWETLAKNELFETASELRAEAVFSTPQETFDLSALSTPLSADSHLRKYIDAYPSTVEPLTVEDRHIYAPARWSSRARRWHVNWPKGGAVKASDSTSRRAYAEDIQLEDTLVPAV